MAVAVAATAPDTKEKKTMSVQSTVAVAAAPTALSPEAQPSLDSTRVSYSPFDAQVSEKGCSNKPDAVLVNCVPPQWPAAVPENGVACHGNNQVMQIQPEHSLLEEKGFTSLS